MRLSRITACAREQEDTLQQGVVPGVECVEREVAETLIAEDQLHRDGATEHEPERQGDERDRGEQRVANGVATQHELLPHALGPCGGDVVLAQHVEQRGSHHEVELSHERQRQRQERQEQVIEHVGHVVEAGEVLPDRQPSARREPPERRREQQDQQHAQPELRHRVEHERDAHRACVERPSSLPARIDAEHDADDGREEGRQTDQQDGRPGRGEEHLDHALAGAKDRRVTEVESQRVAHEVQELTGEQGLVEAELGP